MHRDTVCERRPLAGDIQKRAGMFTVLPSVKSVPCCARAVVASQVTGVKA